MHAELVADLRSARDPDRSRWLFATARSGAPIVASGRPGCAVHVAAAGVTVRHAVELIDQTLHMGEGADGR